MSLEEKEEMDAGMRAMGYGGYIGEVEQVRFALSHRARALATGIYVFLNAFFLWLLRATPGTALEKDLGSHRSGSALGFAAFSWACYAMIQWSDPGYADDPRREGASGDVDYERRKADARAATEAIKVASKTEDAFSTLMPWPTWPPMRVAYCRPAKRWVYSYDHYCPFVANVVGEKNRPRFWLYLLAQMVALVHLVTIAESAVSWADIKDGATRALFLVVVLSVLLLVNVAFFVFHTFLLLTNMTTNEFLRAHRLDYLVNTEDFDLPFSRGLVGNVRVYFGQDGLLTALRGATWAPIPWVRPAFIERDSDDWWNHPWQNKYWSCC